MGSVEKKLDGVKDIKKLGEAKIWDIIEGIWVESNPMYTRRLKAIDLKMEKGEKWVIFSTGLRINLMRLRWKKPPLGCCLYASLSTVFQNREMTLYLAKTNSWRRFKKLKI